MRIEDGGSDIHTPFVSKRSAIAERRDSNEENEHLAMGSIPIALSNSLGYRHESPGMTRFMNSSNMGTGNCEVIEFR
jgi:hypothetical protein